MHLHSFSWTRKVRLHGRNSSHSHVVSAFDMLTQFPSRLLNQGAERKRLLPG